MTKVNVYDIVGKVKTQLELPNIFSKEVRKDLILRAFLSSMSNIRRKHARDTMAGKRTSAHYHGRRNTRQSMANKEMARGARIHGQGSLNLRLRFAPQAVKGRLAHPPLQEKIFAEKINTKERKMAINSAIAATASRDFVIKRGHRISDINLPIIISDELQGMAKTKDIKNLLRSLGLNEELDRTACKTLRAGKGKGRGRKYRTKCGPLIVVGKDEGIIKAAGNISGLDISELANLNAKLLAPGGRAGRLTLWSESAIKKLSEVE